MNSPGRFHRAGGLPSIPEVKSGIFLSELRGAANDPVRNKPPLKVVRTKSGNFKKAMGEVDLVKDGAEEAGTRVTSSYARVLLAGSGFLADAYDLFVINLVLRLLRNEYPEYDTPDHVAGMSLHALEGGVAAAALLGSIIGQLVAGSMADVIGRKKIFVATALLISIGSFGSACVGNAPYFTVYGQLACWRFCLGAGVGGEYPLAATVTSESSSAARRGALMAAVFSMQGVGSLLSVAVVVVCLSIGMSDGFTWRFSLAFGALPVLIAFPFRLRMHETETFKRVKQERQALETLNKETQEVIKQHATPPHYGATASSALSGSAEYPTIVDPLDRKLDVSLPTPLTANTSHSADSDVEMQMQMVTDYVVHDDYSPKDILHTHHLQSTKNTNKTNQNTFNNTSTTPTAQRNTNNHTNANTNTNATTLIHRSLSDKSKPITYSTHSENTPLHTHGGHLKVEPKPPVLSPPSRMNEIQKAFKYYKWHMLGTSLCWFLLDVDFYANGLFNHEITSSIFSLPGQRNTALQDAYYTGILSLIAIPGYWLSVMYIDAVGRKNLQMIGFSCMAGLFFTCSLCYEWLMDPAGGKSRKYLFLLIYALTFLFSNFGPNTTSFVIPGEIFPAEVRATCHGISAASGKLGAATGAFLFPLLLGPGGATAPTTAGIRSTMLVCGLVACLGVAATYLLTPTYDASMLVQEGNYLALDHAFLRPCDDDLMLLDGYECVEIDDPDYCENNNTNNTNNPAVNYSKNNTDTNNTNKNKTNMHKQNAPSKYCSSSPSANTINSKGVDLNKGWNGSTSAQMTHIAGTHGESYEQIKERDPLY